MHYCDTTRLSLEDLVSEAVFYCVPVYACVVVYSFKGVHAGSREERLELVYACDGAEVGELGSAEAGDRLHW